MIRAAAASAASTSAAVWHSTSAASPSPFAAAPRSRRWGGSRIAMIRSTASAPAARASQSWYSSIVKSLRSSGTSTAPRIRPSRSRLPWKYFSSVRTEIAGGAHAISVLTDEKYFQGSLDLLGRIRGAVEVPLLRKDFTIDEYQLWEARAAGADAVLLIIAILEPPHLRDLGAAAKGLGLAALVECHTAAEVDAALAADARIIGINNRDLRTFETRIETTLELLPRIPPGPIVVSESGFVDGAQVRRVVAAGAHAIRFIFVEETPRFVTPERVAPIVRALPPFVTPVGVFWDHPAGHVKAIAEACGLRALQFHGDERPEDLDGYPLPVIKTIKLAPLGELGGRPVLNLVVTERYRKCTAALLLDSAARWSEGEPRQPIEWTVARELGSQQWRIILSAGLTPENVARAVATARPYAVDVNSGVEAEPGRKDPDKVWRVSAPGQGGPRTPPPTLAAASGASAGA